MPWGTMSEQGSTSSPAAAPLQYLQRHAGQHVVAEAFNLSSTNHKPGLPTVNKNPSAKAGWWTPKATARRLLEQLEGGEVESRMVSLVG